jgi:methionyl aminopeptidase
MGKLYLLGPIDFSMLAAQAHSLLQSMNFANYQQPEHKKLHKSKGNFHSNFLTPKVVSEPDPATGIFDPFPSFPYTGPLRAVYPLSAKREVPSSIKLPDYSKDGQPLSEQTYKGRHKIEQLDKEQQEGMRKVCRLAREVLDIAAAAAVPGVTTDYIDEVVHKACMERDVCALTKWKTSR